MYNVNTNNKKGMVLILKSRLYEKKYYNDKK